MKSNSFPIISFSLGFLVIIYLAVLIAPAFLIEGNIFIKLAQIAKSTETPLKLTWTPISIKVILIFICIYVFAVLLYLDAKRNTRFGEEHGSAKLGNVHQLNRKYADKDFEKNRLLTQNLRISATGKKVWINLITLVIGGSGSGKSFYYCIPNLLQANTSFVVLDPSAELVQRTGSLLKQKGFDIRVADFSNLETSFGYNAFRYIRKEDDILRLVKNIFRSTVPKGSKSLDPMWDNQAEALCMAYVAALHFEGAEGEKSMRTLMWMAREDTVEEDEKGNIKETPIMAFFEKLELENPNHMAVKFYKTAMKGAAKTILGVQTTLMGRLNKFNLENVCRMTDVDELDFESIGTRKTALFLVIPAEDSSFNFMVSMIYTQLITTLYEVAKQSLGLKLPVPVHFLMEEFSNVTLPDDFLIILTTARKHNISFSIIIQTISQLKGLFEKDQYKTLVGNCDELLYLGSGEFETQKEISERIGKETITVKGFSRSKGRNGSYSTNEQVTGRYLLDPSEVDTRLGETDALVKIRGSHWVIDRKIDPAKHPNFKYSADGGGKIYDYAAGRFISASIKEQAACEKIEAEQAVEEQAINIDIDQLSVKMLSRIEIYTPEDFD